MIPDAFRFSDEYANLKMPVVIVAGEEDRLVDTATQSLRLHSDIPQSKFHRVPGTGHMVHQTATGVVMSAIDQAANEGFVTLSYDERDVSPSPELSGHFDRVPPRAHRGSAKHALRLG